MAGHISNPHVRAPDDPWSLWRDAITLANAGEPKLAAQITQDILADARTDAALRKMAEARQRGGWELPKVRGLDPDGLIP